jgi:hypothetical protein
MSTQAEVFTKDLERFHSDQKHYLDASGNFLGYDAGRGVRVAPLPKDKTLLFDNIMFFRGDKSAVDDPTLKGSTNGEITGLSNINFGHITKPEEFGGTMLQDLGWNSNEIKQPQRIHMDSQITNVRNLNHEEFLVKGELTAPLVEAQDEQGSEEETQWHCKGCSKFFATKASLKRHHERKKSCKELSEKPALDLSGSLLPEKPYIVDWVDQLLTKAISGDSEKPYCKHCEIEFANKTNLNKHLSKSVACDKLAKQEFLKLLTN